MAPAPTTTFFLPPEDLYYLSPGFPSTRLTVDTLKEILAKHRISSANCKRKEDYLAVFQKMLLPKAEQILMNRVKSNSNARAQFEAEDSSSGGEEEADFMDNESSHEADDEDVMASVENLGSSLNSFLLLQIQAQLIVPSSRTESCFGRTSLSPSLSIPCIRNIRKPRHSTPKEAGRKSVTPLFPKPPTHKKGKGHETELDRLREQIVSLTTALMEMESRLEQSLDEKITEEQKRSDAAMKYTMGMVKSLDVIVRGRGSKGEREHARGANGQGKVRARTVDL